MRAPVAAVKPYSEQYNQIILYEEDLRHCQFEASVLVYITGARKKKPIKVSVNITDQNSGIQKQKKKKRTSAAPTKKKIKKNQNSGSNENIAKVARQ